METVRRNLIELASCPLGRDVYWDCMGAAARLDAASEALLRWAESEPRTDDESQERDALVLSSAGEYLDACKHWRRMVLEAGVPGELRARLGIDS